MKWLKSFEVPLEVIGPSIETLFQLLKAETVKDTQVSGRTATDGTDGKTLGAQNLINGNVQKLLEK